MSNMGLKDILVHVDNSRSNPSRLEVALGLAGTHGAHLTGLYINQGPMLPSFAEAQAGKELLDELQTTLRAQATQAESMFKKNTDASNVSTEWRYVEGDLVRVLNQHAAMQILSSSAKAKAMIRAHMQEELRSVFFLRQGVRY